MKKFLLLLPVAGLLLTGCGDEDNNGSDPNARYNEISAAAVGSLASTYKKAVASGLSLNVEVSGANVHYVNEIVGPGYSKKTDADIEDIGFKLKLDVRNLSKSFNEWELALEINDLCAKDTIIMNNTTHLADDVQFSDIDLGVYLKNGVIYAHLGDAELKSTALSVMDMMFGTEASTYKAMVEKLAKDVYLPIDDAIDLLTTVSVSGDTVIATPVETRMSKGAPSSAMSSMTVPSELPVELLGELKTGLAEVLKVIIGPTSPVANAINFTIINSLLSKIEVNFNSTMLPPETFEGDDVTFEAGLTVNFDAEGALTSLVTNETFNATVGEVISVTTSGSKIITESTHVEGGITVNATVTYEASAISMPDFSGYTVFELPPMEE